MVRVPAPIDAASLEAVLGASLAGSRTLPAEAYTSAAVFGWETERFFEGGWLCVGRAEDLRQPGDQRAARARAILLVRDRSHPSRLPQHLPPPGARAARAGRVAEPARDQAPVPRVGLRPGRSAEGRAAVR